MVVSALAIHQSSNMKFLYLSSPWILLVTMLVITGVISITTYFLLLWLTGLTLLAAQLLLTTSIRLDNLEERDTIVKEDLRKVNANTGFLDVELKKLHHNDKDQDKALANLERNVKNLLADIKTLKAEVTNLTIRTNKRK